MSRRCAWIVLVALACNTDQPAAPAQPAQPKAPAKAEAPPTPTPEPPPVPPVRKDGTIYAETEQMGTRVSINVFLGPGNAVEAGAAIEAAFAEIERIEDMMSEWRDHSELSRFNRAAGKPTKLSPELFDLLAQSKVVSETSAGAFDVTFHSVGQLWSFAPGSTPPTKSAVADKLALVDWNKLELDEGSRTATMEPGMMIGLGAIAKGFAVDRASAVLQERGFANHIVEAGGDTYVSGTKGGKPWVVGVQNPDAAGSIGAVPLSDRAVVTSGDYQRFIEYEGKRYAHILDPKTGWPIPAERSPKSVTLVAKNATVADAYCTAVAVMGAEAGPKFVESRPELEAVIITRDDRVLVSSGLKAIYLDARKPPPKTEQEN